MRRALIHLTLASLVFTAAACSGNVGRYNNTRTEDSIAEVKTRNMAPRTLVGAERDSMMRVIQAHTKALLEKTGLDSATFYNIPLGYVRETYADGTTYLRKQTEKEAEEMYGESPKDFGDIIAHTLDGQVAGKAGYKERGKPPVINTTGLPAGTYMLSIPGEKQMKKIVVQ
jgi:hypothetical protein